MKNVWKYFALLIPPAMIGVVGVIVWYILRQKISISIKDQGVFEPILGIIGIAHGLIASMQITKVNEQHQKIQQAMILKDKKKFDEYACLRISPVIKLLLAVFSSIFFLIFTLYPFAETYTGVIIVWTTLFTLYLLWKVADELDDPFTGISKITPEEIEKAFGEPMSVIKCTDTD